MVNENFKSEKVESKSFPLLKNDVYQCQLLDIVASENNKYQSQEKETVFSFEFAVLMGKDTEGNDARSRLLAKNFVPTYLYISHKNGKNVLYKIVESLIGRELTQEEEANGLDGKFYNSLIGKQVRVLLEKVASKKDATKFYSNISNFLPIDMEIAPLTSDELKTISDGKEKKESFDISGAEEAPDFLQPIDDNDPLNPKNIPF